jgi:phage major head subunit gpT-like protein
MGITGQTNLAAANTAFTTAVSNVLDGSSEATYQQWVETHEAEGTSVEVLVADGVPLMREWVGAKQFHDIRIYRANYPAKQWEGSFALPGLALRGDKTGLLAKKVGGFAARLEMGIEKIMCDTFMSNSLLCYDGVALLSDSHVNVGTGGTSDNLSTSALSFSEFKTAFQGIREMADENGKFLGLRPTHLLVGTAQERIAQEVTGSMRPVPAKNDGTFDGTSSIVSAPLLQNYLGGSVQVIVTPFITGNQWALMALNVPGVKPFGLATYRAGQVIPMDQDNDPARYQNDEYQYSLELDATPYPMAWQCIYGSVTA